MGIQFLFKPENLYKMENIISERLMQVISENEITFKEDAVMTSFENAIKEFDELVEKGFAKRRENNLMSFTDSHLHRITLETYKNNFAQHEFGKSGTDALSMNISTKTNFGTFDEL
jgi:hypothetical protein